MFVKQMERERLSGFSEGGFLILFLNPGAKASTLYPVDTQ